MQSHGQSAGTEWSQTQGSNTRNVSSGLRAITDYKKSCIQLSQCQDWTTVATPPNMWRNIKTIHPHKEKILDDKSGPVFKVDAQADVVANAPLVPIHPSSTNVSLFKGGWRLSQLPLGKTIVHQSDRTILE